MSFEEVSVDAGNNITVSCIVETSTIPIESLCVETYFAKIKEDGTLENIEITPMEITRNGENIYTCTAQLKLLDGGQYAYTYRVIPHHPMLINKYDLGLIKWIDQGK